MKNLNKLTFLFRLIFAVNHLIPTRTTVSVFIIFLQILPHAGQLKISSEQPVNEFINTAKAPDERWNADSIRRSIALFSETAEKFEQLRNFPQASKNLREAAELEMLLGNYQQAFSILKKALKNETAHNLSDEKAKTLSNLAVVLLKTGKIDEAKEFLSQAEALINSTDDLRAHARFAFAKAELFDVERNFDQAIEHYQKSSNLWKESGEYRRAGYALINCAYVYMVLGDPLSGIDKIKEAETMFRQANDVRGTAISRLAFGHLYNIMDEKQEALEYYRLAEKAFPDDMDFLEKARLYNGIGLIYEDYREWKLSIDYRLKALALFRQANYPHGQLATLPSLINLSNLMNDSESASRYFLETQKLSAELKDTYYLAISYRLMGDFQMANSALPEALDYYQKALSMLEKTGLKFEVAYIQDKLGAICERSGDLQKARNYYESSLEISRSILNKFTEAETIFHLARLNSLENKNENALELMNISIEITEKLSTDVFNSKLTSSYFSDVFERYEFYINLLMKMHEQSPGSGYDIQALQAAEKSRARNLLENLLLSEANFPIDADAQTVRREKEIHVLLNTKADKLTDLLSQKIDQVEIEKTSDEINHLQLELEEIKAALKRQSPIYSAVRNPAPFNVEEFQQQILDENTLLLEFSFGEKQSFVWVIGKTEINTYVLPPRAQIESKIQSLRELLAAREMKNDEEIENYQARITQAEADYLATAKDLSRELFGRFGEKFGDKRLVIVPDGKLNYFPISALPLPNGSTDEPILLSNEVIYQPSASALSILAKNKNQQKASKNLLVLSDPVFSETDARISANKSETLPKSETAQTENFRFAESLNSLARLTASRTEADSIIGILGSSNADNYTGFSANRERLLNTALGDYKIIHFATHGLINENRPELSGIVLSRFDENGGKLDEFVRLQDIYGMNLNSDLIVLSACETGIGKEVRGEGLMSLTNAFLQVGAKSVVSSLWKVEDAATLELMKNFYESLAVRGTTPSRALQLAQIKLRQTERYKSPFYWAGFTVQGDFRRAPDLSKDFTQTLIFSSISASILLLSLFWFYKRRRL